jgi:hypothetical protein
VQAAPRHAALPDVLLLLASAEEFGWVKLRRDEKALMKARQRHTATCTHTCTHTRTRTRAHACRRCVRCVVLMMASPAASVVVVLRVCVQTLNGTVRFPLLDERGKPMKGALWRP